MLTFVNCFYLDAPIIFGIDKFKQVSYNLNGYPIIITVKKEKLKRVAVISSNILLQNHTSLPFELTTIYKGEVSTSLKIPPDGQKYPVDFNKIDSTILLNLGDATSQGIDLGNINRVKSHYINIPLTSSSAQYNNVVLDVYTKRLVTFIDIKPALVISNLCPVPIHFAMHSKEKEFSQMVFRSDPIEVFMFDPYRDQTILNLTVNETFTTSIELTKFLNRETKRSITLNDSKGTGLKIHIDIEHNRFLNTIVIYSKFNIFNETGLDLEFCSFNPSIPGASHKLVGNGNDTVLFQSQKSHSTFAIKSNPKTFEKVKDFPVNLLPSIRGSSFFPKNISYNLNEKITGGSGDSYYEYGLAIIPNVVKLHEGILTKTITIAPQYVVLNVTPFALRILQENGVASSVVDPMARLPVVWRSLERRLSVQVIDTGKE
jgi:ribosomal protein L24E